MPVSFLNQQNERLGFKIHLFLIMAHSDLLILTIMVTILSSESDDKTNTHNSELFSVTLASLVNYYVS